MRSELFTRFSLGQFPLGRNDFQVTRSPIKRYGGKYRLMKHFLPFPAHSLYVEAFGGSGVVLLNKQIADHEVFNDVNARLLKFFRVLQTHCEELKQKCRIEGALEHRNIFKQCLEESDDEMTEAFRFFYSNAFSFSGKNTEYCGITKKHSTKSRESEFENKIEMFDRIHERIKDVHFENQDFRKLLKRVDVNGALWYLDPPYFRGGEVYQREVGGVEWSLKDFEDLREILHDVKSARFVLSIDNAQFFSKCTGLHVQEVERCNMAGTRKSGKASRAVEYIVRNFDVKKVRKQNWEKTLQSFFEEK